MFIIYPIALVGIGICVLIVNFRSEHVKQNIIFVEVTFEYIIGVMIPIYILIKKRAVRCYVKVSIVHVPFCMYCKFCKYVLYFGQYF